MGAKHYNIEIPVIQVANARQIIDDVDPSYVGLIGHQTIPKILRSVTFAVYRIVVFREAAVRAFPLLRKLGCNIYEAENTFDLDELDGSSSL